MKNNAKPIPDKQSKQSMAIALPAKADPLRLNAPVAPVPLIDNLASTSLGLLAGYLTKKIFIWRSGNILRKVLGSIFQLGVTNFVARHPEAIKSVRTYISTHRHIPPEKVKTKKQP
jgi:hypothetical protein